MAQIFGKQNVVSGGGGGLSGLMRTVILVIVVILVVAVVNPFATVPNGHRGVGWLPSLVPRSSVGAPRPPNAAWLLARAWPAAL